MSLARRRRGALGERLACWYLQLRGWTILARNVRLAGVEVDIVARRGEVDALVEVKVRPAARIEGLEPLQLLVSSSQRLRLGRAARSWADWRVAGGGDHRVVRVDLVHVRWPGSPPWLAHHPDICR